MIQYFSIQELVAEAEASGKPISQLVLEQQAQEMEKTTDEVYAIMAQSFAVMQESVAVGMDKDLRSTSGLTGGTAYKMQQVAQRGDSLCGGLMANALAKALAVCELNASMGRIVAAPTAGSCGILPATVLSVMEAKNLSEHTCVMGLFTASAVGMVIAHNASLAGAEGGCQAECGSAAAMAAAALVEMLGGSPLMSSHACAIALKNVLGLVCDPVAGLVEIPCIKRNASGAANALISAELALAGIPSAIPADEVIAAMKRVGDSMSNTLKETAEGGLAVTPTAQRLFEQVFGEDGSGEGAICKTCPLYK